MQDCSNSSANALELMESCTKPLIWPEINKAQLKPMYILWDMICMLLFAWASWNLDQAV